MRIVTARSLAYTAVAPLLAALVPSASRAGGEPCVFTCDQGECIDYVCQPYDPCVDCDEPPPTACDDDDDCPHYQRCAGGWCDFKPLPECGAVTPCPDGEGCVDGQCAPVSDPECTVSRPCAEGAICVAGRCEPAEPEPECRTDADCRTGRCEGGLCRPRFYDPPPLTPITLPDPPKERDDADDPPVWNLPDDDDPFGDIPPGVPQKCASDAFGDIVCCSEGTGWSFEKDEVDRYGNALYQPWHASGVFGRGPVYGNNVHIDRIMPPGYTKDATYGPAANVGGDYWAFSRDVNQQGKWWVGSSDVRTDPLDPPGGRLSEAGTGTLASPRLELDTDYIRFFIGGRSMPSQRVQLEVYEPDPALRASLAKLYDGLGVSELPGAAAYLPVPPTEPDWVVVRASAPLDDNEYMHRRVVWDVKDFKGRVARIVAVDTDKWGWHPVGRGWVNLDEVLCTDALDDAPAWNTTKSGAAAKVGQAETPIPLWGTTDSHTHPFVNLAFGDFLVWGDPRDELADVYSCHGELPALDAGTEAYRPAVAQVDSEPCSASALLVATVTALPCEAIAGIPFIGVVAGPVCFEAKWDVLDVLHNQPLVAVDSLHGSSSPLSGGITITGAQEVMEEVTPFMNTFDDIMTEISIDFDAIVADMPAHVHGLVERLAWDTDDGRHSRHGIKGHQLYQKDMIRRAHQGGLRMIGLDVIDSRTITSTLHVGKRYDEWRTIRDTVMATRALVSCGDDPLFSAPGPLCDIAGIARSPSDVRALVARNKLAIVLGTETDELGLARDPITLVEWGHPAQTVDSIELQIQDLHDLGIRKVTAIHALNNPLGGAGIFNDTYLTGNNELANQTDPGKVERSSMTIPFFVAGNFTEDMFAIKHWETDPDDPTWTEWYQDHGGWVALDGVIGDDWIGDGVTFEYGYPSVSSPLGFGATPSNLYNGGLLNTPFLELTPAFNARGTWAGVNEVQFLEDIDQLLSGDAMCKVDGVGLPLGASEDWVPDEVRDEYKDHHASGFANAVGLRPMGKRALEELMKRGMIIDLDHFSQEARVDAWEVAAQAGKYVFDDEERLYPFFGVHTNSRVHERHGPFPDFEDLRAERGYTAETDRTLPEFERSKKDGGVFSPGANAGYMTDVPGEQKEQVRNDCDYSAKSFAHRYLWMMDVMDGRGLTPSTDMSPFFTAAAPRFGQDQCHLKTSYHDDMVGLESARDDNGNPLEFYRMCPFWDYPDVPVFDLFPPTECKFHQWPHDWQPDPAVDGGQFCKIWGKDLQQCPTYQNLQQQYAEGAGVWYEDYAGRELPAAEQPAQDPQGPQVTYVVARRSWEERDDAAPRAEVDEVVAIGGARQLWPMKKMKSAAGYKLDPGKNTGWDVNLDGFPHIGLFPDFLQDVRNVGVSWERMTPMFNAVEDYVRMWERQCRLADTWAAKDGSVPGCK